jgi:hypothetical protein
MAEGRDRVGTIAELEREACSSGSFVDRAIVREIKVAATRFFRTGIALDRGGLLDRALAGRDAGRAGARSRSPHQSDRNLLEG